MARLQPSTELLLLTALSLATPACGSSSRPYAPRVERLSSSEIARIVDANFGPLRACYLAGQRRNPDLRGRVVTFFVVDSTGKVGDVSTNGSSLLDVEVRQCVAEAFKALVFPPPTDPPLIVVYPIDFPPP